MEEFTILVFLVGIAFLIHLYQDNKSLRFDNAMLLKKLEHERQQKRAA